MRPAFLPPTPPPSPPPQSPPAAAAAPLDNAGSESGGGGQGQKAAAHVGEPSSTAGADGRPSGGDGGGADDMDVDGGEKKQPGESGATTAGAGGDAEKDGALEKASDTDQAKEQQNKDQQQDRGVEEEKGGEKESAEDPEATRAAARMETEGAAAQKEGGQKEAAEEDGASKKAEAEAKAKAAAAMLADAAAEKRARRARVSLILKRLKEDAEDRRRSGRYVAPRGESASRSDRHFFGGAAGSADQDEGRIVTVHGLQDNGHRKKAAPAQTGSANAGGAGAGAGSDPPETAITANEGEAPDWPPLGQRRLKRQLECAEKHAAQAQQPGGGCRVRLATMLKADAKAGAGAASVGSTTGGWLEAKLARMGKVEGVEWTEWQRRVEEEASSNPEGQAAGPPLPYGFVPRLAHRALGAYALIRTFSRPFRLTPASSVAFLRALSLRLRTPLLDAVHCELLRRVVCLLKGRSGGWAKSSGAQRELDWKYLDQVGGVSFVLREII